ncbi:hypothetical protein BDZ89DRAFT_1052781 [Hymenopellis radicata]|nr:hypothetical protein BDZ89DRAFT_1052781 [Hymenopellis radicata]
MIHIIAAICGVHGSESAMASRARNSSGPDPFDGTPPSIRRLSGRVDRYQAGWDGYETAIFSLEVLSGWGVFCFARERAVEAPLARSRFPKRETTAECRYDKSKTTSGMYCDAVSEDVGLTFTKCVVGDSSTVRHGGRYLKNWLAWLDSNADVRYAGLD